MVPNDRGGSGHPSKSTSNRPTPTLDDSWFRWDKPTVPPRPAPPPPDEAPRGIGDELADAWFR